MVSVYLSAQYPRIHDMRHLATDLRDRGAHVVSGWHELPYAPESVLCDHDRARLAVMDLDDIDRADVLVIFGDDPGEYRGSGGKFTELGYALGIGLPVLWVGPREGVFAHASGVTHCPDWPAALDLLAMWHVTNERQAVIV
jgi:hypothetical protein